MPEGLRIYGSGIVSSKGESIHCLENAKPNRIAFDLMRVMRLGSLPYLARLYWYTVEFGLVRTPQGLRIYGSGIVSSKGESIHCLENAKPNRIAFDLMRVMRTNYRIDDFQECYFVIENYGQLFDATRPEP